MSEDAGNRRVTPLPAAEPGDGPPVEPDGSRPDARRSQASRRRPWWALAAATLLLSAGVGAWYGLPVRTVTVSGNERLSAQRVQALAGLSPDFGWLYYGAWRARGLLSSPWVASAVVTRTFPDRVSITLTERVPRARLKRPDGQVVAVAADGTVLPGATATESLPLISGWGPDRTPDMLGLLQSLDRYNVQSVAYSPTGVTVKLPSGSVWSGDLQALVKYAGSISMYPDSDIFIYPWGVSVQE
ncbi:FtsQ-type POTRA domain-containing protein [Deinococcus taeanensis]|uniref:cell division protein FtsQ/DivIB n=1 Tax=Deinococcus taeanensis TaxID=2737050 RepID=UPI001CDBC796|nr:FtsQ-type POTRA domain-containing protein [Deinococcus taeanensis]UBV41593.1 FtsQ-type POTRA domain-containing protein [Deinococcus taeanensis]